MTAAYMRYTRIDWLNRTGPMTGISDRTGILISDSENWFVFRLPGASFMIVP